MSGDQPVLAIIISDQIIIHGLAGTQAKSVEIDRFDGQLRQDWV